MSDKCWLDEANGHRVWRACVRCESHGWVDEEVSWDDAKTAWKACQIARERHYDCNGVVSARLKEEARVFALEQIETARVQLEEWRAQLVAAEASKDEKRIKLCRWSVEQATERYVQTREENSKCS